MTLKGFFPSADADLGLATSLIPACGACGLSKAGCHSPKMGVDGKGRKGILVVGEAPGLKEDLQGKPFVGKSGEKVWETFARFGVQRNDCWIYNAAICRPPSNKLPPRAVEYCRPNVIRTINELKPEKIILLGGAAVASVIGWIWPKDSQGYDVSRWRGWRIPSQQLNAWVCPTWHPSAILRGENDDYRDGDVMELIWSQDIEKALALKGRPWETVPDFRSQVITEYDDETASRLIRSMIVNSRLVAFDYETGYRLKPHWEDSFIHTCSLSDGFATVSFPWRGRVVQAMREFVRSDVPKVGANMKYEEGWTRKILGCSVKNWDWDVVLAGHVLDNRRGVSGLKFQSFVHLGQPRYDRSTEVFLKGAKDGKNRVRQTPLDKLLLYGGMDSLLTWKLAEIQKRLIKEAN